MTPAKLARIATAVCGGIAIAWGVWTLPIFWRSAPLAQTAASVTNHVPYQTVKLQALTPAIDDFEQEAACEPHALHDSAVIRLRLMEDAYRPEQIAELDGRLDAVDKAIQRSLGCSPADPFLWLVLYSIKSAKGGFRSEYLNYISMSYRLGPREGWIAVQRNRLVMAIFPLLPPDLAAAAVKEFATLVANRLYDPSADILLGPGWNVRDRLLAQLAEVPLRERTEFAQRLRGRGSDLAVPGVVTGTRPWQQ
jgi:hypothetical protein